MNADWGRSDVLALFGIAGVCFLIQLACSVALIAVTALSRVSLLRLSHEHASLAFVESIREPASTYRSAAMLMRQICLMGGTLASALAFGRAGIDSHALLGIAAGTLVGVLFVDLVAARALALWEPRRALRWTAVVIKLSNTLLYPLVKPISRVMFRLEAWDPSGEEESDEEQDEEVEAFFEVGERDGILEASEGQMMRSIVDLDETCVREIMTPRTDIVALQVDATVNQARGHFLDARHSRLPVYRDSIDDVVGVLHVRDLLQAWADDGGDQPIAPLLREAMFVPEPLSVADLLSEMRVKAHIALVVDEYGGIAGLVTLEDLLEEIVGEIRDEHDVEEEDLVTQQPDGSYLINAAAHVEELEELFGFDVDNRDFDTVGGLVVSRFGRVPAVGEILEAHGLCIEVVEADRRRIRRVRVRPSGTPDEAQVGL